MAKTKKVPAKKSAKKKAVKPVAKSQPKKVTAKKAKPVPKTKVQETVAEEPVVDVAVAELEPEKPKKPKAPRKVKDPFVEEQKKSIHFLAKLEATPGKGGGTMAQELDALIKKYLITASEETQATVRHKVDCYGLTGSPMLTVMRDLQQAIRLKPGFYKQLQNMEAEYSTAHAGE